MEEPPHDLDPASVIQLGHYGTLRWLGEEPGGYDSLYRATSRLFDTLQQRGLPYVLVGGIAMLQYVESRNTRDIDLLMALQDAEQIPELSIRYRDQHFLHGTFDGVTVDILLTRHALFEEVSRRFSSSRSLGQQQVTCATPEGLILLKLFALPSLYRQGRTAKAALYEGDIRLLLQMGAPFDANLIAGTLGPHLLASDLAEVGRIFEEIQDVVARAAGRRFDASPPESG